MKKREDSKLEHFLDNVSFRKWALGKSRNDDFDWDQWIAKNPEKRFVVESAIEIIRGLPFRFAEKRVDPEVKKREWQKLRMRTSTVSREHEKLPPQNLNVFWKIAASLAFIVSLGLVIQWEASRRMVVYSTPFGSQLSLALPDSTIVKLNANSFLRYRKNNPREVWLDGEAFFHVKKKPLTGANFRVITNDMSIEVLGTSFNVIEKEYHTEIILEEGIVTLDLEREIDRTIQMVPGEMVAFSRKTNDKIERRKVKTASLTSWKDGVLEFKDVPLVFVMNRIKEIYGWTASYRREELQTRNISIPLPSDDLDGTLNLLSRAIGIKIEKLPNDRILLLH